MARGRMAGFLREWVSDFRSSRPYLIWAVLTIIIGMAGPFGTYRVMDLPLRLLFWAAVLAVAIFFGTAVRALVHGGLGLRSFAVGSTLIAAILAMVFPPTVNLIVLGLNTNPQLVPPGMTELAIYVFLTSLGVGAYRHATGQFEPVPAAEVPAPSRLPPSLPRLVDRLPAQVQGPLVSITVRDHYIDVTTARGQASLLLRLSDAVAETCAADGVQVHRSHWVAWDAIEAVEHRGTRMMLRLKGGAEVPVSKTYRPAVEERGIGITRAL